MRVFAGPNGSGRSTIIKEIQKFVTTGPYINADDIEKSCREKGFVNLADYGLEANQDHFNSFIAQSSLNQKAVADGYQLNLSFANNVIKVPLPTNSYTAALIADLLRNLLLEKGATFSFETVMSHPSKLEMLQRAHANGFRNYLYFISTESESININRVAARVNKGGHPVDEQKIKERYFRSMDLLSAMIPYCYRCFILDNSGEQYRLILEIVEGKEIKVMDDDIPGWVEEYVLEKLLGD